jgi:hypothetical protein
MGCPIALTGPRRQRDTGATRQARSRRLRCRGVTGTTTTGFAIVLRPRPRSRKECSHQEPGHSGSHLSPPEVPSQTPRTITGLSVLRRSAGCGRVRRRSDERTSRPVRAGVGTRIDGDLAIGHDVWTDCAFRPDRGSAGLESQQSMERWRCRRRSGQPEPRRGSAQPLIETWADMRRWVFPPARRQPCPRPHTRALCRRDPAASRGPLP